MSFYKEVPGLQTTLESTLKFDITPTAGSTNPVTSDGVANAVADAIDRVVPQTSYTALAGNTALPLKVDSNGKLTNNGSNLTVGGLGAWAEGNGTKATGNYSHAEGYQTTASGPRSHSEGEQSKAQGDRSHAEGYNTTALDVASHAEGEQTNANGYASHAEGYSSTASGGAAHSEGGNNTASGAASHAEGTGNTASGARSHAEGYQNVASGDRSHAGGNACNAGGTDSFVHGNNLNTTKNTSAWFGQFNADEDALFGVGNGTDDDSRNNAFKIAKNGHMWANADGALVDVTASLDNADAGNEITETPPHVEYTVGNYYFILGQLCKCTAYSASSATFEISSLLAALNSLNT